MQSMSLERKPLGKLAVDLCAPCQALWFDAFESVQLTPGSVVKLFATINDLRPAQRHPLPARLPCPRCSAPLELTQDQTSAAHFSYHRCPFRHGRFTPFFQFLREKSFIRTLSPADLERLKAHIQVIHCSSCGAPVDLERQTTCTYCHAPISVLDPDAVQQALAQYSAQETARRTIDPVALVDGVLQAQSASGAARRTPATVIDLVALGLDVIHDLVRERRDA
ncbi:MAG TPA: hypothetical protein VFC24_16730 [Casimicrobiaceae bacterium]|nr:hypothetical protein [Casimicrobiaceae bacterium]